ncbi:MAG: hypothetical protein KBS52_04050 [Clostridiales bacterium]|nr:hypothetical protein [Candidatus Equinaster intestinalis]
MDIFCEPLVSIKKSPVNYLLIALIVLASAALCVVMFIYSRQYFMLIFLIVALIYGTIALVKQFFTEYEYSITNGTVDIDKIIAKSRRKRIISFEVSEIIRTARVSDAGIKNAADKVFVCGNKGENACYILAKKGAAKAAILIEPNERFKAAIIESAPKNMRRDLFV